MISQKILIVVLTHYYHFHNLIYEKMPKDIHNQALDI